MVHLYPFYVLAALMTLVSDCAAPVLCLRTDISYAVWPVNALELLDNLYLPACFHLGAMHTVIAALRVKYSLINNNRKVTLEHYSALFWRQLHLPVHNIFFSPQHQRKFWQAELLFHFQLGKHWQALKDGFEEKPWTSKDVNYSCMKKTWEVLGMGGCRLQYHRSKIFAIKPHAICAFPDYESSSKYHFDSSLRGSMLKPIFLFLMCLSMILHLS